MDTPNMLIISTDKSMKTFNGNPIFKSPGLKVSRYSVFSFIGPNRRGKTMATKRILDLIHPTKGSCYAFGLGTLGNSVQVGHQTNKMEVKT